MRLGLSCLMAFCLVGCLSTGPTAAESVRDVFRRVSDSVVVIRTQGRDVSSESAAGARFVAVQGLGSGVLIQHEERIVVVTAAHVVQTAEQIQIELVDGRKRKARVRTSSQLADLALLEVERLPRDAKAAKLANSDAVGVGDRVFVVGAPLGLSHTLTVGYISARRQSQQVLGSLSAVELFQTDAAINSGNSGGPMFNEKGEVIAIVSSILTRSGGFEGVGFAVTANLARFVLLEEPTLWSGVDGLLVSGEVAQALNVPQEAALLIQRVAKGSPGNRLGLRPGSVPAEIDGQETLLGGDVVLSVGGIPIDADLKNYEKIREYLRDLQADDVLSVKVLRAGKLLELAQRKSRLAG